MRAPLAVRVSDGVRDQHVTRFVRDLRFTKTAPGGHHSASVTIDAPDGLFADLGPADRLFVYDGRNARTIFDGYVENPGRTTVAGGSRYDLSAMGGVVLASDNAQPVVFVDRDISHAHWKKVGDVASASAQQDQATRAGSGPGFKAQFQPGSPIGPNQYVGMYYSALEMTGQRFDYVEGFADAGKNDAGYLSRINTYDASGNLISFGVSQNFSVVNSDVHIAPGMPATVRAIAPVIIRNAAATNVTDDVTWAMFTGIIVKPRLLGLDGVGNTPMALETVRATEVVYHLIGSGHLAQVDPFAASLPMSGFPITQLAYLDGAKPRQILDDLSLYEPDYLWEILESGSNGKHKFAYRPWPTTPRYEISGRTFTETGGEVDLCNRIAVSWKDATGAEQVTIRTTTVEALGTRIKDAEPITLPDGQGSEANAIRIGDETLAALNTPNRSGTAVIREPILDRLTGLMVMPWEIEPGYLARVRDIGVDLRLTEMTYGDENCTASLTLGTPTLTQAQRFARLSR